MADQSVNEAQPGRQGGCRLVLSPFLEQRITIEDTAWARCDSIGVRQDVCLGAVLLQGTATAAPVAVIAGIKASKVEDDGTAPALVRYVNWCEMYGDRVRAPLKCVVYRWAPLRRERGKYQASGRNE